MLRGRSRLPGGGISWAADTAPGADVSWRPEARAATPASAARNAVWPALIGSPNRRPERVSCFLPVGWASGDAGDPCSGGIVAATAGTTIGGPLVIIHTKATPRRLEAMNTREVSRQPAVRMRPAATGRATATPIPGPA